MNDKEDVIFNDALENDYKTLCRQLTKAKPPL